MIPSSFFLKMKQPGETRLLHGLVWRGAETNNNAAPLICVHGLTRNSWDFTRIGEALCETRKVIALDMAGRSFSDRLAPAEYNYATYVGDCLRALDMLKIEKADWLGTSMGGLIGMMIAAQHPTRINRLILNDVGPFLPYSALQRIAAYVGVAKNFKDLAAAERDFRATYGDFGIKEAADWRRFTLTSVARAGERDGENYALHYDTQIAQAFRALTGDVNLWPLYEAVKAPTLALRGARSDVLLEKDARDMTLRGPRAKLVTFEGCGHAPALMDQAQIDVVREFLA